MFFSPPWPQTVLNNDSYSEYMTVSVSIPVLADSDLDALDDGKTALNTARSGANDAYDTGYDTLVDPTSTIQEIVLLIDDDANNQPTGETDLRGAIVDLVSDLLGEMQDLTVDIAGYQADAADVNDQIVDKQDLAGQMVAVLVTRRGLSRQLHVLPLQTSTCLVDNCLAARGTHTDGTLAQTGGRQAFERSHPPAP